MKSWPKTLSYHIQLFGMNAALVMLCSTTHAADLKGKEAIIWSPGGKYTTALEEAYVKPFEAETGAKIRLVEANVDEAIAAVSAQAKAGNVEWDGLSSMDAPYLPKLINDGVIQKIDASKVPGLEKLPKSVRSDYGIPILNSVVTVSYRDADNLAPLKSVRDFFDPHIKGARAMSSNAGEGQMICTLALLSEGVSVDELSKGIDVNRCLKIVDRIKNQVTSYWANGSQMAQLMIDNNVDYCLCWDGRIIQAAQANPQWKIQYNGGIQFPGYLVYTKGTKNADLLDAFSTYMLDPKRQAEFTKLVGYSAPNPESITYLPDYLKPFVSVTPEAQAVLTGLPDALFETMSKQQTELGKAWQAYVSQ
ncbi:ABC transporter substrate-binding protein [Sinorhizobium meliloti]|uniref:ABC transporter substrate-binding protein n=1 Tax=Rhizobium meliloti TaxID=382 RepID=UPI000FDCCED0|nr:extracellular solute-binding protein [Sinorhizobium meliloti]MDE3775525.1 extracellular solute-binding protein [Sinorhizobium meliloti]RVG97605.1 extracellular solute-binding protein [Sinorhizobium meliloti]RVK68687.1 extracellular solute-binding protein [Sinorhizobium meliloti]